MFRGQSKDALGEIYVRNLKTGNERQIKLSKSKLESLSLSACQKDKNTDLVYLSCESPITPYKTYLFNLKTNTKVLF